MSEMEKGLPQALFQREPESQITTGIGRRRQVKNSPERSTPG
jgi:hypothetical protein